MSAPELAERLAAAVDGTATESFGAWTVDVSAARWVDALTLCRDDLGLAFFDWLSAVDELTEGFSVVCHLADPETHDHLLVRTRIPRESPSLPTATTVFRGAGWHERETHEMFAIDFPGHPHLVPLLLPDGFEGHPLRKEFVLAARAAKAWPGAKEPGEAEGEASPSRRKTLPPGVPDPERWGPRAPGAPLSQDAPIAEESPGAEGTP